MYTVLANPNYNTRAYVNRCDVVPITAVMMMMTISQLRKGSMVIIFCLFSGLCC